SSAATTPASSPVSPAVCTTSATRSPSAPPHEVLGGASYLVDDRSPEQAEADRDAREAEQGTGQDRPRGVAQDDLVLARRHEDGAEEEVGWKNRGRRPVDLRPPPRIVAVGDHDQARARETAA